jgi:hypothetical protein
VTDGAKAVAGHAGKQPKTAAADLQTLNFKVPRAFKKAFKLYAVEHGISMIELLREGFELSKKNRKS